MDEDRPMEYKRDGSQENNPQGNNWMWPLLALVILVLGIWGLGTVINNDNLNLGNPPQEGQLPGVGGGPDLTPTETPLMTVTPTPTDGNLPQLENPTGSSAI